ncbi:hypothetical protein FHG87_005759 [Trinorchestia longiramus]|nr:hypothetical protein FHG87_005759 [Trinorchestia longiramus]
MIVIFLFSTIFTADTSGSAIDYTFTDFTTDYTSTDHDTPREHPRRYDAELYSLEFHDSHEYQYDEPRRTCKCAMFLVTNSDWMPEHKVFTTGEQYTVNCSQPSQAEQECRKACEDENTSVTRVFRLHPEALYEYPPSEDTPCSVLPAATAIFYQTCGSAWTPLLLPSYSHVCCHPHTLKPTWCDAIPDEFFAQPELQSQDLGIEDRGLDLEKDPNDIENNEIEGSIKPDGVGDDFLGGDVENQTWMNTILNFFGYNSLAEMVQGFDIFSLPQRFRHAVRVYRDEVGMGQCYMEYTTYSIFTKGENPFEAFMRSKRSLAGPLEITDTADARGARDKIVVHFSQDEEYRNNKYSNGESKQAQIETIKSLVGSLVNMLDQSESTKRYAVVIRQLLPVVTRVYAAEDPQQAVHTLVSSVLGPYLEKLQIQNRRPKPGVSNKISEKKDKLKYSKPSIPDPPSSSGNADLSEEEPSQISTILLNLVRQYMGIYFNTLPGATNKIVSSNVIEEEEEMEVEEQKNEKPTVSPSKRPSRPSQFNWMRLLNLFLGGPGQPRPRPSTTPTTTKPPKIDEKKDEVAGAELVPPKNFVDVILEVIRPVFISILGKAPGDSGVASIREVSRLSVLGRVDAAVADEILSPYFCLKTYGVNKAWSLTERTLRNFAESLTPEEIETVRALLS